MVRWSSAIRSMSVLLSLFLSQILYPLSSVFSRSVRPLCSNPLTNILWTTDALFSSTTVMHSEQRNRKDIKLIKIESFRSRNTRLGKANSKNSNENIVGWTHDELQSAEKSYEHSYEWNISRFPLVGKIMVSAQNSRHWLTGLVGMLKK